MHKQLLTPDDRTANPEHGASGRDPMLGERGAPERSRASCTPNSDDASSFGSYASRPGVSARRRLRAYLPKSLRIAIGVPLLILVAFAVLFVGLDELERHVLPEMSTAQRHLLLTTCAAIVAALLSLAVYLPMRKRERYLSQTAERIARLLESYTGDSAEPLRFENPHLVHCRDVVACQQDECRMYTPDGERCWQVMALGGAGSADIRLQQCHACPVYKASCPDKLIELGESFNSLMYMLERRTAQVDRMRKQMVEKQKMVAIGQIAAGIAHEVGNPLSSISSVAQLLKRHHHDPRMTEQLDIIGTHIQRISDIVRQLVNLARPGPESWVYGDIGGPLRDAMQLISFDKRARNVEIDFEPTVVLPKTHALLGQFQQVFLNLGLNAFDAMPDGGTLTVRAKQKLDKLVFTIEDTGSGMSPEVQRQIFNPFFTTKDPGQGTGLGLAVSHSIVQKHGGTIKCRSVVGKGTTFTIQVPILDNPPDTHDASDHRTSGG
jgi:signal transduction histidine kinase